MKRLLPILLIASGAASCSFEKRLYRSGFYIDRTHGIVNQKGEDKYSPTTQAMTTNTRLLPMPTADSARLYIAPTVAVKQADEIITTRKTHPIQHRAESVATPVATKADKGMDAQSMITIGWVCTGLAIVSLFVLWPLVFFVVPGVIFLILGYRKKGGGSSNNTGDMVDVVYLKNGSIIKGTIIEQVPNVSIKIQTADGSVFFYKMEEIEKIAKESK